MSNEDEKLREREQQEKALPFGSRFLQAWLILFLSIGWVPYLVLGVHFGAISVLLVGAGTALLALVAVPFMQKMKEGSKARIRKYQETGDVPKLLATVYWIHPDSSLEGSTWLAATGAMIEIGSPAVPLLRQALFPATCPLKSPLGTSVKSNENLRLAAAYCLGRIGDASTEPDLIRALGDEGWAVRKYASEALARMNSKAAIAKLTDLSASDPNQEVRDTAARVIREIG